MSPWTALLESLHSALIDELNERLPDHKPELGMPTRQREFAFPTAELPRILVCEASFGGAAAGPAAAAASSTGPQGAPEAAPIESRGFAAIGLDSACAGKLGVEAAALWEALIKRAGSEFLRRGIRPRFGTPRELQNGSPLPPGFISPNRVIWIPFRLHPGLCYLMIGA